MTGLIKEFKEFLIKGNMLDMAVGIIIGAAFGTVVKSLVSKVIMPPIGLAMGGLDFSQLKWTLQAASAETKNGEEVVAAKEAVAIEYGAFFNDVISLVIVGFCVFMLIKAFNAMKKKEEEAPAAPAEPSDEVKLLTEIRDSLKKA